MSYGFTAYTGSGSTQVDENYTNLAMIQKYTWTRGSSGWVQQSLPTNTVIAFVRGVSSAYYLTLNPSGAPWADVYCQAGVTVTLYVFGPPTSASIETHGVRVYNSSGALTFDSGWKPLKIGPIYQLPDFNPAQNYSAGSTWPNTDISVPSDGKTYAAFLSGTRVDSNYADGKYAYWNTSSDHLEWLNATTLRVSGQQKLLNGPYRYMYGPRVILADVTGY